MAFGEHRALVARVAATVPGAGKGELMKDNSRVALALAAGYVLGRRHKLRTAAVLAGAAATGRLGSLGSAVVKRATGGGSGGLLEKVAPQLGGITSTVRSELANAGKAAAMAVVNNRIESLSDSLHQRTEALRAGSRPAGRRDESPDEDEPGGDQAADRDEPEDRAGDSDGADDYEDEEEDEDEPEDAYDEQDEADERDEPGGDDQEADEGADGAGRGRAAGRRSSPVSRAGG